MEELTKGLPALNEALPELTRDNVEEIFQSMDTNKDGVVSESEFLSACCQISDLHLEKAFRALDTGKNNYIDMDELQAAYSNQGTCTANTMPEVVWN